MNQNIKIQAFPSDRRAGEPWAERGMTLLDYFSAMASERDISDYIFGPITEQVVKNYDGSCSIVHKPIQRTREQAKYLYAKKMMEARNG